MVTVYLQNNTAMPEAIQSVEMHIVLKISLVVRREALSFTLSVEGCTDLKNIMHFYSMRVTVLHTGRR